MIPDYDQLPDDSGDFEPVVPPPMSQDLPAPVRLQLEMGAWQTQTVVGQLQKNARRASKERKQSDLAAENRHKEVMTKIGAVDDKVDSRGKGVNWEAKVTAAVKEVWSVFKQPLAMLLLAIAAFMGWRYFNVPSTPTPILTMPAVEGLELPSGPPDDFNTIEVPSAPDP